MFRIIALCLLLSFLLSCASSGSLGGGPRDTSAPRIIEEKSSQNLATNTKPKIITLQFDEYVELQNAIEEINVSPPITYIPKVVARGKKVVFQWNEKEVLKENTTYTIDFGKSIVDLHEANPLKDFRYVFGTGNVIDSLVLYGSIVGATTSLPAENVTVALYDILHDSVVIKSKPVYLTKSDKVGRFTFKNLRADTFALYAFKDDNKSKSYNEGIEELGFLSKPIIVDALQSQDSLTLEISKPNIDYKIFDSKTNSYGIVRQKWNTQIYSTITAKSLDPAVQVYTEATGDSIKLFYNTTLDTFTVDLGIDTIGVKVPTTKVPPRPFRLTNGGLSTFLLPVDSIIIRSSTPLKEVDINKISLVDTSKNNIQFKYAIRDGWLLCLYPVSQVLNQEYKFTIDSSALTDIFGQSNNKYESNYSGLNSSKTSELKLEIIGLDSSKYYFIALKRSEQIIRKFEVSDKSTFTVSERYLYPDVYQLEIIEDINRNGRWDPIIFKTKTQAEKIKSFKIDKLKENWTLDTTIDYLSIPKTADNTTQNDEIKRN